MIWNSGNTLTLNADGDIIIDANVYGAGAGAILNSGGGVIYLGANNQARLDISGVSTTNAEFNMANNSTVNLLGDIELGSLDGDGTFNLGSHALTVGSLNNDTLINPVTTSITFVSDANGSLIKTGTGIMELFVPSPNFQGNVYVNNGTLRVWEANSLGTIGNLGVVYVNSGGTFEIGGGILAQNELNNDVVVNGGTLAGYANIGYDAILNGATSFTANSTIANHNGGGFIINNTISAGGYDLSVNGDGQITVNGSLDNPNALTLTNTPSTTFVLHLTDSNNTSNNPILITINDLSTLKLSNGFVNTGNRILFTGADSTLDLSTPAQGTLNFGAINSTNYGDGKIILGPDDLNPVNLIIDSNTHDSLFEGIISGYGDLGL